jgi:outer membrane protein assembly factor BamB
MPKYNGFVLFLLSVIPAFGPESLARLHAQTSDFPNSVEQTTSHPSTINLQSDGTALDKRPRAPNTAFLISTVGDENDQAQSTEQVQQRSIEWTRTGDDWPRILGPNSNSQSSETGIRKDWSNEGLPMLWSVETGTGYANCVAAKGRVFQFDRFGDEERLDCYVAETGERLWKTSAPVQYVDSYGYNNGPRASPVVVDDLVLTFGVAGRLACHEIETGKTLWSVETNTKYGVSENFFGVAACPLVWNDDVWVMVGGSQADAQGQSVPNGTAMVCFDLKTGEERAQVGQYLASYSTPIAAKLDGRKVALCLVREGLLAIDLETREQMDFQSWRAPIRESVNAASPVLVGQKILISETYGPGSIVFELRNGKLVEIWRDGKSRKDKLLRAHWATPVAVGSTVFACSGRNEPDSDLRCFSVEDYTLKWFERTRRRSTLLAVDEHLLVLGEYGELWLIEQNSESLSIVTRVNLSTPNPPNGQRQFDYPLWAPPVLSHGLLFIRGPKTLGCFELISDE